MVAPTAAESLLPWKRNTGREAVSSCATHNVPDDTATTWSPNVDAAHVSIDMNTNAAATTADSALPPPPWRHADGDDEDDTPPVRSPSSAMFEKCDESHSLRPQMSSHSFRLSEAESRHSAHIHVTPMIDKEAEPREGSTGGGHSDIDDIDAEQIDNQERVSRWLMNSDAGDEGNDDLDLEPPEVNMKVADGRLDDAEVTKL